VRGADTGGMTEDHAAKVHHGGVHDLAALADELAADADRSAAARSGRTLVTVGPLRMTAVALAAGAEMAEHENPGAATLQVLAGSCRLVAGDDVVDLGTGALAQVPDRRHALTTDAGCVVLLTVALLDGSRPPAR
jgi:quercetin dioxygenase-like cupin family protein